MIERCLWELRRALGRRLPPDVLTARLREAEGHLRAAASEMGEAEAIRRYGPVRNAANGMVRVQRGYATASPWRLSSGVGLLLFAGFALPLLWMDLLLRREQSVEGAILAYRWAPFLALLAFGLRVVQTRRWLTTPATAWLAAAWVFYVGGSIIFLPFPTGATSQAAYERTIRHYDAQLVLVDAWRRGSPPPDRAPQLSPVTEIVNVPMTPLQYQKPGDPQLDFGTVLSREESHRLWDRYGPVWAAKVKDQRKEAIKGAWRIEESVDWGVQLSRLAPILLLGSISSGFALALTNAAALGFAALGIDEERGTPKGISHTGRRSVQPRPKGAALGTANLDLSLAPAGRNTVNSSSYRSASRPPHGSKALILPRALRVGHD